MLWALVKINLLSIFRDRIFHGIITASFLFFIIPSVSGISMRMVTELALNLSISLTSFILLLLTLLVAGTAIWKDIDRRYSYSVLSLPLTRDKYLFAKFASLAIFFLATVIFLGIMTYVAVIMASHSYPPNRPIIWSNIVTAYFYEYLKYLLLASIAFLFSSVSTSFFLPIFGTISIFMVGTVSQQVYDYVSLDAEAVPALVARAAKFFYYILPNLSAFDLKVNAVYAVATNSSLLLYTFGYWMLYTAIMLSLTIMIYRKREMI